MLIVIAKAFDFAVWVYAAINAITAPLKIIFDSLKWAQECVLLITTSINMMIIESTSPCYGCVDSIYFIYTQNLISKKQPMDVQFEKTCYMPNRGIKKIYPTEIG